MSGWKLIEYEHCPLTLIKELRENYYPAPEDCPHEYCREFRPACRLGICKIAVVMCGDF